MKPLRGAPGTVVLHEQVATYADPHHPECLGRGYRGAFASDESLCDCARERFFDAYMLWGVFVDSELNCMKWGPWQQVEPGRQVATSELDDILAEEGPQSKKIREAEAQRFEKDQWTKKKN